MVSMVHTAPLPSLLRPTPCVTCQTVFHRAAGRRTRTHRSFVQMAASLSDASQDCSRRNALLSLAASTFVALLARPAHADLRTFLQGRQAIYALAPLRVADQRLQEAAHLLANASDPDTFASALRAVRAASFNCYTFETRGLSASFIEDKVSNFQQNVPALVDPCTYNLIAKNVTSLLRPSEDHLRAEVNDSLSALLRSFNLLDDALERAVDGDEGSAAKVVERMNMTQENSARFEDSIKSCLHLIA